MHVCRTGGSGRKRALLVSCAQTTGRVETTCRFGAHRRAFLPLVEIETVFDTGRSDENAVVAKAVTLMVLVLVRDVVSE